MRLLLDESLPWRLGRLLAGHDVFSVQRLILDFVIDEIQHVHGAARLAEPLDPAEPLFQPRRIPPQIGVDERTEGQQVQTLARRIGGDREANLGSRCG